MIAVSLRATDCFGLFCQKHRLVRLTSPLLNKAVYLYRSITHRLCFLSQKELLHHKRKRKWDFTKAQSKRTSSLPPPSILVATAQTRVGGYCCLTELIWICGRCGFMRFFFSPNSNICLRPTRRDFFCKPHWQMTVLFFLFSFFCFAAVKMNNPTSDNNKNLLPADCPLIICSTSPFCNYTTFVQETAELLRLAGCNIMRRPLVLSCV